MTQSKARDFLQFAVAYNVHELPALVLTYIEQRFDRQLFDAKKVPFALASMPVRPRVTLASHDENSCPLNSTL